MTREEKMKIVINNYFKTECSVNTSIREAFEKGFRIGASKVQKKPEVGTDCISRQAAIDAILHITNCKSVRELFEYNQLHHLTEMWSGGVNDAIDAVIGVDSAQLGTNLAEVGTDCISRQQAIDEIDEWIKAFRENGHKESAADACLIQDGIIQLPSAQPEPCEDAVSRKDAIDGLNDAVHEHNITDFDAVATILALPLVTPKQRTDTLKAEIKRMKRSFTTCINSDYYTGYMSALSAVEGYIAQWEGEAK